MAIVEQNKTSVSWVTVEPSYSGQRIDNYLMAQFRRVPKSVIYKILRRGEVRVNSKRIKPTYRLREGDKLRIPPVKVPSQATLTQSLTRQQATALNSQILYEDDVLLVLNKASGVAVHGGSGVTTALIEQVRQLEAAYSNVVLVHRLDRATSGCILLVKDRRYLAPLHQAWHSEQVSKRYVAMVRGVWTQGSTTLEDTLQKVRHKDGSWAVKAHDVADDLPPGAKMAKTEVKVRAVGHDKSLLELKLYSGRTHQLRVQLASAGFPIVGDDKYGDFVFNREQRNQGYKRLMLHAENLAFPHPVSDEQIQIKTSVDWSLT